MATKHHTGVTGVDSVRNLNSAVYGSLGQTIQSKLSKKAASSLARTAALTRLASAEERLARCTALLGRSKSCVNVTNKPTGVERATRAHVAGRDFNRVDVCDLKRAPRTRPGA